MGRHDFSMRASASRACWWAAVLRRGFWFLLGRDGPSKPPCTVASPLSRRRQADSTNLQPGQREEQFRDVLLESALLLRRELLKLRLLPPAVVVQHPIKGQRCTATLQRPPPRGIVKVVDIRVHLLAQFLELPALLLGPGLGRDVLRQVADGKPIGRGATGVELQLCLRLGHLAFRRGEIFRLEKRVRGSDVPVDSPLDAQALLVTTISSSGRGHHCDRNDPRR